MTAQEIITKFELQVDDITELSSAEELDLVNDKYQDICAERQWEFLKKAATGALTQDTATSQWYIPKPDDFANFSENATYTDNSLGYQNDAAPKVIFVGQAYQPFQIVNYSDRVQYRTHSGVCWLDQNDGRIYFPVAPSDTSFYVFDYIRIPPDLTLTDSPVFLSRFHKMIAFAMAVDDEILQRSPKAKSYANENASKYEKQMELLEYWDAAQINN